MKKIILNEETTQKFKEALKEFMVNPKKGNAMLDEIFNEQQEYKRAVKNAVEWLEKEGYMPAVVNDFIKFMYERI